jgi:hypothetical protein
MHCSLNILEILDFKNVMVRNFAASMVRWFMPSSGEK